MGNQPPSFIGVSRRNAIRSIALLTGIGVLLAASHSAWPAQAWRISHFQQGDGLGGEVVRGTAFLPDGSVWFACWGGGVSRYDGLAWTTYTEKDGLPALDVRAICADRHDGLWAITTNGIAWFDGHRWHDINTGIPGQEHPAGFCIVESADGSMWFSTESGEILEFSPAPVTTAEMRPGNPRPLPQGQWTVRLDKDFTQGSAPRGLFVMRDGRILAAIPGVCLAVYRQGAWSSPWPEVPVPSGVAISLSQDADGTLWMANLQALWKFDGFQWERAPADKKEPTCVLERVPGELWIGTPEGLFVRLGDQLEPILLHEDTPRPYIDNITLGNQGELWIGTRFGVSRIAESAWHEYSTTAGGTRLAGGSLYADPETPPLAVDTFARLHQFDGASWRHVLDFPARQSVCGVSAKQHGRIWFLFTDMLVAYSIQERKVADTIPCPPTLALVGAFEMADGHLVAYSINTLYERAGGQWLERPHEHYAADTMAAAVLDKEDNLWIADGMHVERWRSLSGGLALEEIIPLPSVARALFFGAEDKLYVAMNNIGIHRLDNGRLQQVLSFSGAASARPACFYQAVNGVWWVGGRERSVFSHHDNYWVNFGQREGISGGRVQCIGEYPAGVTWVGIFSAGIHQYAPRADAPKTEILNAPKRIPYDDRGVFQFTANDRWKDTPAEKMLYSWRIRPASGLESEALWKPFKKETAVVSPDLVPGQYVFEVRACDLDRNIDPNPARAAFDVIPPVWATRAFQAPLAIAIAISLGAAWLAIRKHLALAASEHELRIAKDRAESANRAKSTFLANISHEIRTPLNAILGYTQLLEDSAQYTSEQRTFLQAIDRSGKHLLSLINGVLELSKIEAGRIELVKAPFDLAALVRGIDLMFAPQCRTKGLAWSVHIAEDAPQFVESDEGRIREILVNLLGNALKFTQTGEIALRVSSGSASPEARKIADLVFEVADTGIGISESEQATIFESFSQTAQGMCQTHGSGLGLAISRHYARLMGGCLTVSSQPGKGSVFRLTLPAARTSPPVLEHAPKKPIDHKRIVRTCDGRRPNLLVVDDNEMNRDVLVRMLQPAGFDVRSVETGEDAIAAVINQVPDAILMDMIMPGIGGCEALKRIKSMPKGTGIPIIMVTANALEEGRAAAFQAGADAIVNKPFHFEELLSELYRTAKFEQEESNRSLTDKPDL